jgi:dienelactone hydrolase
MSRASARATPVKGRWAVLGAALAWPTLAAAEPPTARPEVMAAHRFDASLNETLVSVPITVETADGVRHETAFQLTHFRPAGAGPFPLAVLHHGRGIDNSYPSRHRTMQITTYFLRRGFAVLVPTRMGYGGLGNAIDPERPSSPRCDLRGAELQVNAVAAHTFATLTYAAALPWADPKRVVIAGGSVGGYTSVATASREVPGLAAVINFAGGVGGNPKRRPGNPCAPERLTALFSKIGGAVPVPTLWIYAENDKYWGPQHPRDWHGAFVKSGGTAELLMLGPTGDDGHEVAVEGFAKWRPVADAFLVRLGPRLGVTLPRTPGAPPATSYAKLDEAEKVPANPSGKGQGYARFLRADVPRAFVIAPSGSWAYAAGRADALKEALRRCEESAKQACEPYAVDDTVVWAQ